MRDLRTFLRSLGISSLVVPCMLACGGTPPAADAATPEDAAAIEDTGTPAEDAGVDAATLVDANTDAGPPPEGCALTFSGCGVIEDLTDQSEVTITVTGGPVEFAYAPHCIRVSAGTVVSIPGSAAHPLQPATCSAPDSPIPAGPTETDGDYTFTAPGAYGFFCMFHGTNTGAGMAGLIVVE